MKGTIILAIIVVVIIVGVVLMIKQGKDSGSEINTTISAQAQTLSPNAKYHGNPHFRSPQ